MAKTVAARTSGRQLPETPLQSALATPIRGLVERRDLVHREALSRRVFSEFAEMPGLVLTIGQASRLFGISTDACARILSEHVLRGRLRLTDDSHYTLAGSSPHYA